MVPNFAALFMVILVLNMPLSFGLPTRRQCPRVDQIAIKNGKNETVCIDVKECPHGYGLSIVFDPTRVYPFGTRIACDSCKPGETLSDEEAFSQCRNCTQCKKHEVSSGQCDIYRDSRICTGKCEEGFYMVNSTCFPCSPCCGNKMDEIPEECNRNSITPRNRCSVETNLNCPTTLSPKSGITTTVHDKTTEKSTGKPEIQAGQKGFIAFLSLVFVFMFIAWATTICCPKVIFHANHECHGNSVCSDNETSDVELSPSIRSHHGYEQVKSVASSIDSLEHNKVAVPSGAFTTPVPSDLGGGDEAPNDRGTGGQTPSHQGTGSEAPSNQCEAPNDQDNGGQTPSHQGTGSQTPSNQGNGSEAPSDQHEAPSDKGDCDNPIQKIKDIPENVLEKICEVVDKEDIFYQDYRSFGEEMGMTTLEVKKLEKSKPTLCILQRFSESYINVLVEALKAIGRYDEVKSLLS